MQKTFTKHGSQNLYSPAFKTKEDRALFELESAKIDIMRNFHRLCEEMGREEAVRWIDKSTKLPF